VLLLPGPRSVGVDLRLLQRPFLGETDIPFQAFALLVVLKMTDRHNRLGDRMLLRLILVKLAINMSRSAVTRYV